MPPIQVHGLAPRQDTVICLTIDRQTRWKINATLATTSKKISKEEPCHKLITRTMARLLGSPTVRSHPNRNRKMGSGAPKKARLIAVALTIRLTTQRKTASRKVLRQVDNSLTIDDLPRKTVTVPFSSPEPVLRGPGSGGTLASWPLSCEPF